MPVRTELPPQLLRRPFTLEEAAGLGVGRHLLREPAFLTPHRGVRVPADLEPSFLLDAVAASLVLPQSAFFSEWSAVRLLGLPTPAGEPEPVGRLLQVRVPDPDHRRTIRGVACTAARDHDGHRWATDTRLAHLVSPGRPRALRVQDPLAAWCDLAPGLRFVDAVALGDAVRKDHASQQRVEQAVAARDGRRGAVQLRRVLTAVRFRVDSPMETATRLMLVDAGLPEPECGRLLPEGRVDMVWCEWKVVLEYDGDHHRTRKGQWREDQRKRRLLAERGWSVIVMDGDDVDELRPWARAEAVERVRQALRGGGAPV